MTTPYFRNFNTTSEQNLVDDLVNEALMIHGIEVWYLPRRILNPDNVIVNDKLSEFYSAYPLTAFIKNVDGFAGQGDFLSRFGLEIRDQLTLTVSRKQFIQNIVQKDPLYQRPKEGDVIFFPLNNKLWEIRFVEHEAVFYQMGKLQTWDLQMELYQFNNEIFNTHVPVVDALFAQFADNSLNATMASHFQLLAADGTPLLTNDGDFLIYGSEDSTGLPDAENDDFQTEANKIIDFSEADPYAEGFNY